MHSRLCAGRQLQRQQDKCAPLICLFPSPHQMHLPCPEQRGPHAFLPAMHVTATGLRGQASVHLCVARRQAAWLSLTHSNPEQHAVGHTSLAGGHQGG